MVLEWNSHKIRKSKNSISPSGRPMTMFKMPQHYSTESYFKYVDEKDLEVCEEECIFNTHITFDETLNEICQIIITEENLNVTNDPYELVNIYIKLRNTILMNVENRQNQ